MSGSWDSAKGTPGRFAGKKLLVLGSNVGSCEIVEYARANGARVAVADWLPAEQSPAKLVSDEALLVSTADIDALCKYATASGIDAVLAGVSEFNLLSAMKVSERCSLPFYCTRDQWDEVERKDRFRELCLRHGVPAPRTYYSGRVEGLGSAIGGIGYPAVLKPVDGSSSEGVFICRTKEDLLSHALASSAASSTGDVIVEQFVEGAEFTAHYVVRNGEAALSCVDNRYPIELHEGATSIPIARVYPSLFIREYMDQVDRSMISLCESLGMENGILFAQGIYDSSNNRFAMFEAGLRSAGESPSRFLEKTVGVNYFKEMVNAALEGDPDPQGSDDPFLGGRHCAVVSMAGRGGVVRSIEGVDEALSRCRSIVDWECRYPVGSEMPCGDTLRQIILRFVLVCNSRSQLADDIALINSLVKVIGDDGESMALGFDPSRLSELK